MPKIHTRLFTTLAASLIVAAAPSTVLAERPDDRPNAQAQAKKRHQPPRWETKQVEHRRTENGYERATTWTGPDGRTATRNETVVRDPEARTRTRDVTWTGPDGKQRTVHDVVTKTDDGHTRSTVITGNIEGR